MEVNWVVKSIAAMFLAVPFVVFVGVLGKFFKTPPEAIIFYWLFGSAIGIGSYLGLIGKANILAINTQLIAVTLLGITTGATANILLMQSMVASPNPGIPTTILGANSVIAFALGPALALVLPTYFQQIKFDWIHLLGIALTLTGIGINAIHR